MGKPTAFDSTHCDPYTPHLCVGDRVIPMGRDTAGTWQPIAPNDTGSQKDSLQKNGDAIDIVRIEHALTNDDHKTMSMIAKDAGMSQRCAGRILTLMLKAGTLAYTTERGYRSYCLANTQV